MKLPRVTIVVPHCYDKEEKKLNIFRDGLSIMVGQIVSGLASQKIEVQVYMTNEIYSSKWHKRENVSYYNNSIWASIINLGLRRCIKLILSKKYSSVKDFFFLISNEAFWENTNSEKNIINFHDLTINNCYLLKKYMEKGIPCILTLHIYIGKDISFGKEYDGLRRREREILQSFNGHIVVVSEGMKKRILCDYPKLKDVEVIENGIQIEKNQLKYESTVVKRKKILCVGTICKRKNQIQLLNALKGATDRVRKECIFTFCGSDTTGGKFEKEIKDLGLSDFVTYIGAVDKMDMKDLYLESFAVISCSLSEAFGLTIIEAYSYGRPCIYFNDIDAADYLTDKSCSVLIKGKKDEDIINAINVCIDQEWNNEEIKKYAMKFDMENTINKYIRCYGNCSEPH